ncbi:hypothetical protein WH47_02795 [Habropoda laboriosa]|uniref:Uncharacterized protein n=1 Tax=Habropoda laboriosa TaxID=597456 RepID=A0A0L7QYR6_9HYME|nr:hypothetical protein WH47_02795 [Habropoda laboriosa]
MKQRIIVAYDRISPAVTRSASTVRRLQSCVDANGNHFEHLFWCQNHCFTPTPLFNVN